MKKCVLYRFFGLLALLVATACSDDLEIPEQGVLTGEEVLASLDFGFKDFEPVRVATRATLDEGAESRVHNIFVMLFVNEKKVFSKFYDAANRRSTNNLKNEKEDCWWVENVADPTVDNRTSGQICMRAPGVKGANLYLFANIDADMVNVSPESLYAIQREAQVKELTASMNQETVSRNGYFPMAEKLEGVTITRNQSNSKLADVMVGGKSVNAQLERLDAKVQFYFKVAVGHETTNTEGEVTETQKLKAFVPESWRVVNIPKGSYVMPGLDDNKSVGYFNTDTRKFETADQIKVGNQQTEKHGFSFYMLENREVAKKVGCNSYHLRDKRLKDAEGRYDTSEGMWEYAPEEGTYLEVKGRVVMEVDVSSEAKKQQLEADVKYYIHLGDLSATGSMDNFKVERNTAYTYTITIKGVNSIEVEVETSKSKDASKVQESESGSTGMVYVAKESIYTFDAHYGQRVFCFDAAYIVPETVTWYVKTPFGKEGTPNKVGDTEVASGMDYKWVHFYINKVATNQEIENSGETKYYNKVALRYSHYNQPYPGDKYQFEPAGQPVLMNVIEFTKYIKKQKRALDAGDPNDFRLEFDQEWYDWYVAKYPGKEAKVDDTDKPYWRKRIYMTVYVDEFYYDADPITGVERQDLWKEFVNQPNRLMHILCDSDKSLDEESTATGSVVTLRQQSIQTPYNLTKNDLKTAWGCECVDETENSYLWFFDSNETFTTGKSTDPSFNGTSKYNGAYNTAMIWGLNPKNGSFKNTVYWNDKGAHEGYLNFDVENDHQKNGYNIIFLKDDYASMRYAAMMRNRDNNGNGKIDPEELRWYIASIDQLYGLYMGQYGINDASALYTKARASQDNPFSEGPYSGAARWRYHVVSSTGMGTSGSPIELWAEEGVSTSSYKAYAYDKPAPYAIRCVRNLGIKPEDQFNANYEEENVSMPAKLIKVNGPSGYVDVNSVYRFDLSNINVKSLRFFTSHELEPDNEFSEMSLLYAGFETGPVYQSGTYQDTGGVRDKLKQGLSPCTDPEYRVPNVREGALMSLYCTDANWWNKQRTCVSSFYSNGIYGSNRDKLKPYYSWQFGPNFASIGEPTVNMVRSVRDWNPNK